MPPPEFIIEGIGPASFRSHYLKLDNGLVLNLFTADITVAEVPADAMAGETIGLPLADLLGRQITSLVRDDVSSSLVVLDGLIFLQDANDGCYGNPLYAGQLAEEYDRPSRALFVDYWTGMAIEPSILAQYEEKMQ